MQHNQHGFTMPELLTAITIIAILAATILAAQLIGARRAALDTQAIACGRALQAAQSAHYNRHQTYTSDTTHLDNAYLRSCDTITITAFTITSTGEDYSALLAHPNGSTTYHLTSHRIEPDTP